MRISNCGSPISTAFALLLMACAEGDNVFRDSADLHSGRWEEEINSKRVAVQSERRTEALLKDNKEELESRDAELKGQILAEQNHADSLNERLTALSKNIEIARQENRILSEREQELRAQIGSIQNEISTTRSQLGGSASDAELNRLRNRLAELEQEYEDLYNIYSTF